MKPKKINSLYIHIPFCEHICSYCDFTKLLFNQKFASSYLGSVFCELDSYQIDKVNTLYIGGGTPTSISDEDFERLLNKASSYLADSYEFTAEANVENLSDNKLAIMKKYGVNRLSIGVESSLSKTLNMFNRHHSFLDAVNAVKRAKNHGFTNINVDLIYGYEGQTLKDLDLDLENILSLDVPHISIYSLTIHPGTLMYNKHMREQNQDDSRMFYDEILKVLRRHGYERYEISNFAKKGYESKHNMTYWRNQEYYGIGLGASGYVKGQRYTNTKNLDKYNKQEFISSSELVTSHDNLEYYLMLNLRLAQGFSRAEFKDEFGYDFYLQNQSICDDLIKNKLMIIDDYVKLTDEGLIIMDSILLKFF